MGIILKRVNNIFKLSWIELNILEESELRSEPVKA